MEQVILKKIHEMEQMLLFVQEDIEHLQKLIFLKIQWDSYLVINFLLLLNQKLSEGSMEKIILEKLSEVHKILLLAQQNVEYIQKIFFVKLKKNGQLLQLDQPANEKPATD